MRSRNSRFFWGALLALFVRPEASAVTALLGGAAAVTSGCGGGDKTCIHCCWCTFDCNGQTENAMGDAADGCMECSSFCDDFAFQVKFWSENKLCTVTSARACTSPSSGGGTSGGAAAAGGSGGTATGGSGGTNGVPVQGVDLVVMIDNSPAMASKISKFGAAFPRLLAELEDPNDHTLPDLRLAIIDSDLGTGAMYVSGSCGPNMDNLNSPYGDFGNFQMRGASGCGVTGDALWLEYTKGRAVNYDASKDISAVFGCLATNLGTIGCGVEHQLQAFEFALIAKSTDNLIGRAQKQDGFLRPTAFLGLVILSDEDDCSAAPNDGMFGDASHPELKGESAGLRCATRAHQCNGTNVNTNPPAGAGYPTTGAFISDFAKCSARTDACPNSTDGTVPFGTEPPDTWGNTECSPLKDFRHIAAEMKGLKGTLAKEKLLVAGIFGWPRNGNDGKPDMVNAKYRIDLVPNPNPNDTAHPQIYDYWPVCYDPDHMPKTPDAFDADAWGWGAQGGLRLSAFIDEFGESGLKYSICERDFSASLAAIGAAVAKALR